MERGILRSAISLQKKDQTPELKILDMLVNKLWYKCLMPLLWNMERDNWACTYFLFGQYFIFSFLIKYACDLKKYILILASTWNVH